MRAFFFASLSGWLGTIFIGAVALLPYLLRRSALGLKPAMALPSNRPYLERMWPHYWLAYAATVLCFLHAWIVMSRGRMTRTSSLGLYLATLALLLLFLQVVLGLTLQQRTLAERRVVRSWHFWTMAGVIVLIGSHIWLNR